MRTFHVNAQGQQANRKIKWCYGFYCIPDTENIATPEAYEAMRRYFGEQMGPEFADGADVVITSLNEIFAPRPEIIIVDPDAEEVLPAPAPSEVVAEGQSVVHGGPGEIPGTLVVQIGGGGSGNLERPERERLSRQLEHMDAYRGTVYERICHIDATNA